MTSSSIIDVRPTGFPWQTFDPFLFCAFHDDRYPAGNARLGPAASLVGRQIGMDFSRRDGWSMYHGDVVPGFPRHPHRGFETITIVRRGLCDHSDSLGARARFGRGDVQWMTAGSGIVHAEMFPLLDREGPNPLELIQLWLNLPRESKMVPPYFTMFWGERIPVVEIGPIGAQARISVIAGELDDHAPLEPPPDSWAARADSEIAIWLISLDAGASITLPAASARCQRTLYVFGNGAVQIEGAEVAPRQMARLEPDSTVALAALQQTEALLLTGHPLGEPVVQHGPFVMSTMAELKQAMVDYHHTGFGGWPWPDDAPVNGVDPARFALHPDGRREQPDLSSGRAVPPDGASI